MDEWINIESQIDLIYYILPKYRLDKKHVAATSSNLRIVNSVQCPNSSYYTKWQLKLQKKTPSITSRLWGGHFRVGILPCFQQSHGLVFVCVCATWSQRAHKSIGSNPPVTRAHG